MSVYTLFTVSVGLCNRYGQTPSYYSPLRIAICATLNGLIFQLFQMPIIFSAPFLEWSWVGWGTNVSTTPPIDFLIFPEAGVAQEFWERSQKFAVI